MSTKKELLQEKKRYGLKEKISDDELEMLKNGAPIQKIMGFIEFDDVRINVNHKVLIPRYETEEVINEALKYIKSTSDVLDLCTGSGYIGLTIKSKTNAKVTMSDIDDEAIRQSQENAKINNLKVSIIKSDMFKNINNMFNVIVANPPYIPSNTNLDQSVLNYEPHHALFGSIDGNHFLKIIVNEATSYLKQNGVLILEISEDNSPFLIKNNFKILKDINGKDRIAIKVYN